MMRQWKGLINNLKINNMYTLRIGTRNGDVFETENMDLGNSYSVYGKGTKEYASAIEGMEETLANKLTKVVKGDDCTSYLIFQDDNKIYAILTERGFIFEKLN